jgi:cyclase
LPVVRPTALGVGSIVDWLRQGGTVTTWQTKRLITLVAVGTFGIPRVALGQGDVRTQELAPGVLLIVDHTRNLLASVGADGAFLVGPQTAGSSTRLEPLLHRATRNAARYVVLAPVDSGQLIDDAGWSVTGAFVTTHEWMRLRLRKWARSSGRDTNETKLPVITYSEVIAFDLNGEEIHTVHMPAGYSNADAITHLHKANVIHLGGSFTSDGYPRINLEQKGSIGGLIETVSRFLKGDESTLFLGDRGPVAHRTNLRAYHAMLVAVNDRVQALADSGLSEDAIVRAKPTAALDARWGKGPISADEFVRAVYRSLRKE